MKKKDFLTYYSSLSNVELFKIIQEKENYQSEAVETAREILVSRNYSTDEMEIAKSEIDNVLNKKKQRKDKIDKKINRLNELIDENFGIKEKTPKKILNLFCFVLFLYNFIIGFLRIGDFTYLYTSKVTGYAIGILLYVFSLLVIFLLYKRSNWGWVLMVATYIFLSLKGLNILIIFMQEKQFLIYPPNPYFLFLGFCFHVSVIVFLNTKRIVEQFTISKINRILTLAISIIVLGLFTFPLSGFL